MRITLGFAIIPLLVASAGLYYFLPQYFYLPLLLIPVIGFFTYKYAQSVGIELQEDLLIITRGWVFPKRILFPYHKAQSMKMSQSIFIRRRDLIHLTIYTAAGSIRIRFLPQQSVEQLYDFCLYRTETHRGKWM
jgi:putative membrane protein